MEQTADRFRVQVNRRVAVHRFRADPAAPFTTPDHQSPVYPGSDLPSRARRRHRNDRFRNPRAIGLRTRPLQGLPICNISDALVLTRIGLYASFVPLYEKIFVGDVPRRLGQVAPRHGSTR